MDSPSSHPNKNGQTGFTLIEVVLYLALFGMITGSLMVFSYSVTQGIERSNADIDTEQEGGFIIDKLRWLLDNSIVKTPGINSESPRLTLSSPDSPSTNTAISVINNLMQIQNDGSPAVPLVQSKSYIDSFSATQTADHKLTIQFHLNGKTFTLHKLLATSP